MGVLTLPEGPVVTSLLLSAVLGLGLGTTVMRERARTSRPR